MSIVGSTLLIPPFKLPLNFVVGDFVLVALVLIGWRILLSRGPALVLARQMAPWFLVYVIGFTISLFNAGFASWALAGMARNFFPIIVFLVIVALLTKWTSLIGVSVKAFVATGLFVATTVVVAGGGRSSGIFKNPNYAAHYMACACLFVPYLQLKPVARYAVYGALLIGIARTGSFGALAILLCAVTAAAWRRFGQAPRSVRGVLRGGVVIGAVIASLFVWNQLEHGTVDLGHGVSSERFEFSSKTRFELWGDGIRLFRQHPLGIGATGIESLNLDVAYGVGEIHNDFIDTLVAGGIPAVVGMFGLVAVIWRAAGRGSRMRVALLGLIATSATRQTWNFRHMWIFLAIALAIEIARHAQTRAPQVPLSA